MKQLILSVLMIVAGASNASIITADFKTEADLPYCAICLDYRVGPRVAQSLGQSVGAGIELDATASVSNPTPWNGGSVFLDLDPITNRLTLLSNDESDFETFSVAINNIVFSGAERIIGLTLISDNLTADVAVAAALSFTDNSLFINYDSMDGFYFTADRAVFQIVTERLGGPTSVPEPASLAMLVLGLAILGCRRKSG